MAIQMLCRDCERPISGKGATGRCGSCATKVSRSAHKGGCPECVTTPVPAETLAKVAAWRRDVARMDTLPRRIPIGVVIAPPPPPLLDAEPDYVSTYGKGERIGISTCPRCGSRMPWRECPKCRYRSGVDKPADAE